MNTVVCIYLSIMYGSKSIIEVCNIFFLKSASPYEFT